MRARDAWLGVNFWSRAGGPHMWREYDADVVGQELSTLADAGLDTTRSFLLWPDFMPEPERLDEAMMAAYRTFLDQHRERGMRTIPTFLVGHMSGDNFSPAWRNGRDLYRDAWMLAQQAWFIRNVVGALHDDPAVAGWLISNEMPIFASPATRGAPEDREVVTSWAELMVQAVRAGGGHQPVSLGDGAWGIEVTGVDNGYAVRELAPKVDFLGPHVYRMDTDVVRAMTAAAFTCAMLAFAGKPIVLEEFGVTSAFASEENAAHLYRMVLHSTLLAGARGWLAWNNTDYDHLFDVDPYRHHAFEMYFGVTDAAGHPKAALGELRAFASLLDGLDVDRLRPRHADVALVVPAYMEHAFPSIPVSDGPAIADALRQAWIAAAEADLQVDVVRELDGVPDGYRLYVVPSVKALLSPTWHRLEELARGGAAVYVSYCAGEHGWQRGPWWADMERIFGVVHRLRYGLVDPVRDASVTLRAATAFGGLAPGDDLAFAVAGTESSRSMLPVVATTAEVLLEDGEGRPALLRRRVGAGTLYLGTYPLEHMASRLMAVNPEDTWRVYDAVATDAGVERLVVVDDPRVHCHVMEHGTRQTLVWFLNLGDEPVTTTPTVAAGFELVDRTTGGPAPGVSLGGFGVVVLELRAKVPAPTEGSASSAHH